MYFKFASWRLALKAQDNRQWAISPTACCAVSHGPKFRAQGVSEEPKPRELNASAAHGKKMYELCPLYPKKGEQMRDTQPSVEEP